MPYIMFPSVNLFSQVRAILLGGGGPSSWRTPGLVDSVCGRYSSYSLCVTEDFREGADFPYSPCTQEK